MKQTFALEASLAAAVDEKLEMGTPYTVRALSSDACVLRYGYVQDDDGNSHYGYWYLDLPLAGGDLSRVKGGACPLLHDHGWQHLGVVEDAVKTEEELQLTVRWTKLPTENLTRNQQEALELWGGVEQRTRNAYSIGTQFASVKKLPGKRAGKPIFRAEAWELTELSLVNVGACGTATRLSAVDARQLELDKLKNVREEKQMPDSIGENDFAQKLAALEASMQSKLEAAAAGFESKLAAVRAEGTVRLLQQKGLLKAGDDVASKLAPALVAVPNLEEFLAAPVAGTKGGKAPLLQPPAGSKGAAKNATAGENFSATTLIAAAKKDGVDPYSLIEDDEN